MEYPFIVEVAVLTRGVYDQHVWFTGSRLVTSHEADLQPGTLQCTSEAMALFGVTRHFLWHLLRDGEAVAGKEYALFTALRSQGPVVGVIPDS